MTDLITDVFAVVPAFNEEELVGRCLTSLIKAQDHALREFPGVTTRLIVVADSCTDDTATIAKSFTGVELVEVQARQVGVARAAGVDVATASLRTRSASGRVLQSGWLASTDADSVVPVNWFAHQLSQASSGADVIVGTVRPDFEDLTPEQIAAWTSKRTPGKPNGHVHGSNLGIRASSYVRAGGFDPVSEHEDNNLVARLRSSGARIVASDEAEVLTSGRQVGKTPGGYAGYLAHDLVRPQFTGSDR